MEDAEPVQGRRFAGPAPDRLDAGFLAGRRSAPARMVSVAVDEPAVVIRAPGAGCSWDGGWCSANMSDI
jgi:hypothetical protein